MPAAPVRVLLLLGSLRAGSVNGAVLETARALVPAGVTAVPCTGTGALPIFNPDDDVEGTAAHPAVAAFRAQVAAADAVLVCTPEYAGALPAALKNVLEWTVGDGGLDRKPVAWINASSPAAPTGGADAHASLAKVLGWVGADVVDAACVRVPLSRTDIGPGGVVAGLAAREAIAASVAALAARACATRAAAA